MTNFLFVQDIFEYQKELINQNFDTTISYVEILDYYNNNIDKFKLDQDIFKGRLVEKFLVF